MQENVIQHFKKIDSVFFIPHFVLQVLVRNGRKLFFVALPGASFGLFSYGKLWCSSPYIHTTLVY